MVASMIARSGGHGPRTGPPPLGRERSGMRLGCSWRHVLRLADRGAMPWGLKLGSLRRSGC